MKNLHVTGTNMNDIYTFFSEHLLSQTAVITNRKGDGLSEIINASFELTNPLQSFATCRGMSFKYLTGEIEFYLSGSPYLKDIEKHSKFWSNCSDDGVTINSNYGKLLFFDTNEYGKTQFEYALGCLLNNIESKKAVMVIYDKNASKKSNDNPCTMFLQFFVRNGKLELYTKMRSSDIWFGLPYDVPFFVLVQRLMVLALEVHGHRVKLGSYNHNSGSLHLYHRNVDSLQKSLDSSYVHDSGWSTQMSEEVLEFAKKKIPVGSRLHNLIF